MDVSITRKKIVTTVIYFFKKIFFIEKLTFLRHRDCIPSRIAKFVATQISGHTY